MKRIIALSSAAILLSLSTSTFAANTSATFRVLATVNPFCSISGSNLTFPAYSAGTTTDDTGNTTVTVTCTKNTAFTVALNGGSKGTISQRVLTQGDNTLKYNLFQDAGFRTLWGDGTTGSTQSGTSAGQAIAYTVYGNIPASQYTAAGEYTDTITATVNY